MSARSVGLSLTVYTTIAPRSSRDIPMARDTFLHLRKRRYRCDHCGKRFAEENTFVPRYYRVTSRLVASVIREFRKVIPVKEIAAKFNISAPTAMRYFAPVSYRCQKLPEVLSIDEFKGNAGGQKYQTILTDPKERKVLDILPDRYESNLIQYFKEHNDRENVKYFVSDMNPHFREVAKVCFPEATIIADRYHVTRQALWGMERVRVNEQKKLSDNFRKYFKRSRWLLNKSPEKLTDEDQTRLALMFEIAPRLADAYRVKNEFLEVMHSGSASIGKQKLIQWLWSVEAMELPEFEACTEGVSQLVPGDPERPGCPLDKWLYRRLQQ